jgi:hypothetical protein
MALIKTYRQAAGNLNNLQPLNINDHSNERHKPVPSILIKNGYRSIE